MAARTDRPPLPSGPYAVVGLARSGQAAARVLASRGEDVTGIDSGSPPGAERLRDAGVEVHLDGDREDAVERAGCVVKSPGVPREAGPIRRALTLGIPVISEVELAWRLIPNRFIAVTGTNGKTTVSELLGHLWREASEPVTVAGNVGTALVSLVDEIESQTTVICEVSSFQLEDTRAFAPECAMLLNLTPDHLDRHGSFERYTSDKLRIFANQGEGDVALVDRSDPAVAGLTVPGDAEEVDISVTDLGFEPAGRWMAGPHNLQNARFASIAAERMGIDRDSVKRGLSTFTGVPHRLELVAELEGVRYVNDSKATNVAAAVAALNSFEGGVHALMGGSLKGGGFDELAGPVAERCRAVYLSGPAAEPIAQALAGTGVEILRVADIAEGLSAAHASASAGETVLLAPACASFDAFENYEARGEHFRSLVSALGVDA